MGDHIIRQHTRVLYPTEYRALRAELSYPHQLLFDGMLFTGMRTVEFWRFLNDPTWFKSTRKCIDLPRGSILKAKCRQAERTALLSNWGLQVVEGMVAYRQKNRLPPMTRQGWSRALTAAGIKAVNKGTLDNLEGIVPKMTRKTWISWLLATHPEREGSIAISSGHDVTTMLKHYTGLGFPADEIQAMRVYTAGWGE